MAAGQTSRSRNLEKAGEPFTVDGNERRILDVMLAAIYPQARVGNPTAVDQVLRIMELRLKHTKQKKADEPW